MAAEWVALRESAVSPVAYRYQVTSVGMWRGKIKRWNTTFHLAGTDQGPQLYTKMQAAGYKLATDVVGDCSGGTASIAIYGPGGGAPIARTVYFDWQVPASWIPYTGTNWASIPEGTPLDAAGESALVVVGNMGALSSTGKPVTTRKYFHAVPSRTDADFAAPDVSAAVQAAFQTAFNVFYMANPAGTAAASVSVEDYYLSHQRVRGRRRTVAQVASNAFTLGVLAGGGATTSGQGEPFPGGEF